MPFHYTSDMEPFHPLTSDVDADPLAVGESQAACALALGRLDGLLDGLNEDEKRLFCWTLLRQTLLGALVQAGFADAEMRFDGWFAGTDRAPRETALTSCPAHALVRAVLAELTRHPWQPLADAALVIDRCGRFSPDRALGSDDSDPSAALAEAAGLVMTSHLPGGPLPFPALAILSAQLRQSRTFAPIERGEATPLPGTALPVARTAPRTPLWAIDLHLGHLLAAEMGLTPALPFCGAVTAEALAPRLRDGERAVVLAEGLCRSAERHIAAIRQARADCRALGQRLRHLRTSARAPQVWLLLRGFAPMGIEQLTTAFAISRRGTYAVADALVEAGLARRAMILGRVALAALPHGTDDAVHEPLSPLPSPLLAEFDAAMADIDRLLARQSG